MVHTICYVYNEATLLSTVTPNLVLLLYSIERQVISYAS